MHRGHLLMQPLLLLTHLSSDYPILNNHTHHLVQFFHVDTPWKSKLAYLPPDDVHPYDYLFALEMYLVYDDLPFSKTPLSILKRHLTADSQWKVQNWIDAFSCLIGT